MDAKHIRIIQPAKSGSTYLNYKKFYSMVLFALVNSNYEFIFVDIGKNGRTLEEGVFEYTQFYNKLLAGKLNFPDRDDTKHNLNYVFAGDERFCLHEHLLTPYLQKEIDNTKRIYNYRLSHTRNVVENTFGVITSRFQILRRPINMKPENICYVILAICSIHNYLRRKSDTYFTPTTVDRENESGIIVEGDWRQNNTQLLGLQQVAKRNATAAAKQSRDEYKRYFNSIGKKI